MSTIAPTRYYPNYESSLKKLFWALDYKNFHKEKEELQVAQQQVCERFEKHRSPPKAYLEIES
jgi:hypothetical protein